MVVMWIILGVCSGLLAYLLYQTFYIKQIEPYLRARSYHIHDWPNKDRNEGKPYDTEFDGVDVSTHQGLIRWGEVECAGKRPQFVYVRVMRKGGGYDETFDYNVDMARRVGIPVGAYVFYSTELSATEHFDRFLHMVDKDRQDLIPMIDVEEVSVVTGGSECLKDSVLMLAHLLEEYYGCKPMIYSGQTFYKRHLRPEFDSYPLWIANYNRQPQIDGVRPIIWQRSEKGHVEGFWTDVDLDVFINGGKLSDILMRN